MNQDSLPSKHGVQGVIPWYNEHTGNRPEGGSLFRLYLALLYYVR